MSDDETTILTPDNKDEAIQAFNILLKYVVLSGLNELKAGQKETRQLVSEVGDRVSKVETALSVQEAKFSGKFTIIAALGSGLFGVAMTILGGFIMKRLGL